MDEPLSSPLFNKQQVFFFIYTQIYSSSVFFITQRVGGHPTALYLGAQWKCWQHIANKAKDSLPRTPWLCPPCKHTSYVNRNHISLDCLGLLPRLLFWCWQRQGLGPVCLSVKVGEISWGWRPRSPDADKPFFFRWRERTLPWEREKQCM